MSRNLAAEWMEAKAAETAAIERRRQIEDEMTANPSDYPGYKVRVTARDNWKIDSEKLQEVAEAAGLTHHLPRLFRWKPEVEMRLWKASDEAITRPLLDAITITPARASYSITKED
jgi:hypothetical protein